MIHRRVRAHSISSLLGPFALVQGQTASGEDRRRRADVETRPNAWSSLQLRDDDGVGATGQGIQSEAPDRGDPGSSVGTSRPRSTSSWGLGVPQPHPTIGTVALGTDSALVSGSSSGWRGTRFTAMAHRAAVARRVVHSLELRCDDGATRVLPVGPKRMGDASIGRLALGKTTARSSRNVVQAILPGLDVQPSRNQRPTHHGTGGVRVGGLARILGACAPGRNQWQTVHHPLRQRPVCSGSQQQKINPTSNRVAYWDHSSLVRPLSLRPQTCVHQVCG